jgi:hypothetical protein
MIRAFCRGTLLVLVVGSIGISSRADTVFLGQTAEISAPWFACRNKDDLEFLKNASGQRFRTANRYAAVHDCIVLHIDDSGIVEDASVWTSNSCIRMPKRLHCYWFPDRFIKKKAQQR